jgi:hypothetical protein
VILKDKKNIKRICLIKDKEEDSKIYTPINTLQRMPVQNTFINDDMNLKSGKWLKEDIITFRSQYDNENIDNFEVMKFPKKKSFLRTKSNFTSNESKNKILTSNNINIYKSQNNLEKKEVQFYPNLNNKYNQKKSREQNREVIDKIIIKRSWIYFLFCYVRRRKTTENILLDEGMNIIAEKLDIFNIFEKMFKYEEIKVINKKIIVMSDESKRKLKNIDLKIKGK